MGGVLIEWNPELFLKRMGLLDKEAQKLITDSIVNTKYWHQYDLGIITRKDIEEKTLKKLPEELRKYGKKLINNWVDYCQPVKGMSEYTKSLQAKGYKVYMLTNAGKNQPYYIKKYPYDHFDGKIVSSLYGVCKPDRKIYELLLKKYNLNREECIFTDDNMPNVEGARKAGMKAVLYRDLKTLKKDIKELL